MPNQSSWATTQSRITEQPDLEYVGFWARVGAAIIDTIMVLIVTAPLTILVYGAYTDPLGRMIRGPMDFVINFALPMVVVITLWHKLGATPGKIAMSAKIVDATTGEAPSMSQLLIRYVGYFVSTIPLGLGLMWVGFDRRKQGWHDKMANTVVIRPAGKEAVRFSQGADIRQ